MPSKADLKQLLLAFIGDEDRAMAKQAQGGFYSQHHVGIKALIPRASALLDDDDLLMFYFHLLRLAILPAVKRQREFELLHGAYQSMTPLLEHGYPACHMPRAQGIFLFGNDGTSALPDGETPTLATYMAYRKVWAHVTAYVSIPTMLAKRVRFLPYAQDQQVLTRVMVLLRALRYLQDENIGRVALWYWGLVYIAVLDPRAARTVVGDVAELCDRSDSWLERLELLRRCLVAAGEPLLVDRLDALATLH